MTHEELISQYLETIEDETVSNVTSYDTVNESDNKNEQPQSGDNSVKLLDAFNIEEDADKFSMLCRVCGVDTAEIDEYYMIQFDLWQTVVPKEHQKKYLCIGCLEGYLGRKLVSEDFIEAYINYDRSGSDRLMDRLGQWFRDFDGPYETSEDIKKASKEFGRRMDGKVKRGGPKYMARVDVNTENIVRGNLTLAKNIRAVDEFNIGDTVFAHNIAEEADFFATVAAVEGKSVYLKMDWDSKNPW